MDGEIESAKKIAAEKAIEFVEEGMIIGLGTGTTIEYAIKKLSELLREKKINFVGIPTSLRTEKLSKELGIPLSNLNEYSEVDLCIDGADQVDSKLNLIKGGGGAHTREKIVASVAKKFLIVVDYTKLSKELNIPVPIEVLEFSRKFVEKKLDRLDGKPKLRENFKTDNGNIILDTKFKSINPEVMEIKINEIPGVVENGIFFKRRPEKVIVGFENKVKTMER